MNIKVNRIKEFDSNTKLKAFVDLIIEGSIVIKGFKIMDGENGLFVSYPSEQGKEGEFFNTIRVLDIETREQINEVVLGVYNAKVKNK